MSENVNTVKENLLPSSQQIAMEARKFEKQSNELKQVMESRNFWAGSPKCLMIFGGAGGIGAVLFFVIRAFIMRGAIAA